MALAAHVRRVESGSLGLRVLEWDGGAPPVLMVHATSFCAEIWRPVWHAAREAVGSPLRAWAVDQRGHGASDAPPRCEDYGWQRLAADVEASARALVSRRPPTSGDAGASGQRNAGGVILVGHSSGATACLAAASRLPGVSAVVAIEPVLFDPPLPGADADSFAGSRALAGRSLRRRARFESPEAARATLRQRSPYSGFAEESLDAFLEGGLQRGADGGWLLRCAPQHESWAYQGAAELDLWPQVAALEIPVYLILGEHSAVPPGLGQRLRRLVRIAAETTVAQGTHFVALERPDEVGRCLAGFLAEVAGS